MGYDIPGAGALVVGADTLGMAAVVYGGFGITALEGVVALAGEPVACFCWFFLI
jgi:hypothetical protein